LGTLIPPPHNKKIQKVKYLQLRESIKAGIGHETDSTIEQFTVRNL
jgi:hypothetical protein